MDPTAAVYCATKYAVRALSEGLRQESRDVRVTVVSPGFTRTELTDHGGDPEAQAAARAAADLLAIPASANASVTSRHMFWSHPNPCASITTGPPSRPVTVT